MEAVAVADLPARAGSLVLPDALILPDALVPPDALTGLDVDTFCYLKKELFDDSASCIRLEEGDGGAIVEARVGLAQPGEGALASAVEVCRSRDDAEDAYDAVGLLDGQLFVAGAPVLEGA